MTTSADLVREMIEEMTERVGPELLHSCPERVEALWMEVEGRLHAADLAEMLGDVDGMTGHFGAVNRLLGKIIEELPE